MIRTVPVKDIIPVLWVNSKVTGTDILMYNALVYFFAVSRTGCIVPYEITLSHFCKENEIILKSRTKYLVPICKKLQKRGLN
jgi:hypothetical protein